MASKRPFPSHQQATRTVQFRVGDESYPIHVVHDDLRGLLSKLAELDEFDQVMLGYDDNTYAHCGSRCATPAERPRCTPGPHAAPGRSPNGRRPIREGSDSR